MKKLLSFLTALAMVFTFALSPALMAEEMNDHFVIGEGYVTGDPNFNFDSLPDTEGVLGVKLDSTDEDWKMGIYFHLPSETVMMYAADKTMHTVDENFHLVYVLIKAGSDQSGGGDWVFMLNDLNEFELISFPEWTDDHYTLTLSDGVITVVQTDSAKDVSHISFFFTENDDADDEESDDDEDDADDDDEESDDDEDDADADDEESDDDEDDADADDEESDDDEDDADADDEVLFDPDDDVLGEMDEEQPDTATADFIFLALGLVILLGGGALMFMQTKKSVKD